MSPHRHRPHMRFEALYPSLLIFSALLFVFGLFFDTPEKIVAGLRTIVLTEDALITDYFKVAGPGAALVNSALVTAISVLFLRQSGDPFNGMTLVVVGLMSGFSLFGKNFVNIWPFFLGTWLYARSRHEPMGKYTIVSLMSTALAPIISYVALDNGWGNLPSGILMGVLIGFVMPSLSAYTYRIQNGMNLYNVGFASGVLAMLLVPLIDSFSATPHTQFHWASGYNHLFAPVIIIFCLFLIAIGFAAFHLPPWATWAGYRRLLQTSGRSPSDYFRMFGPAPTLVNIGINGIVATLAILLIGGELNGPTIGGILTVMGFSAFGKHLVNILPLMVGVALGSMLMEGSLNSGNNQLAILFVTTLAPISGYFGWPYGILAGFLHCAVVRFTGTPVSGMNLYNNGFSGGLVAIVLYPTIMAIARHRKPVVENKDFFDAMEHDEPILPPEAHLIIEEEEDLS